MKCLRKRNIPGENFNLSSALFPIFRNLNLKLNTEKEREIT